MNLREPTARGRRTNPRQEEAAFWLKIVAEKARDGCARRRPADIKKRRFPKEAAFLIMTRKEELLCPWQAWQRPTLPGLKP
jgi:hypothetical protein